MGFRVIVDKCCSVWYIFGLLGCFCKKIFFFAPNAQFQGRGGRTVLCRTQPFIYFESAIEQLAPMLFKMSPRVIRKTIYWEDEVLHGLL